MNVNVVDAGRSATERAEVTAKEPVGDAIARALADMGVTTIFGVISIHNMPILDAIARQGRIRFIPARGEAGAMGMADAYARVSRALGVVITSTGTAAGNAAGAQVEALTAGSPLLHITTQVDREFVDRDRAAIHDVPRQPDMLKAISKSYMRVWQPEGAVDALVEAARTALTAPTGPVTLEIPVDVQRLAVPLRTLPGSPAIPVAAPDAASIETLAARLRQAKRPMLWLGGGARGAAEAATALVARGIGVVTSTNGRAVVPEGHAHSLGAFNMTREASKIYARCDLMIVVGSRLRGNETQNNHMTLPPLAQIDADTSQAARNYPVELFVHADAKLALEALLKLLPEKLDTDAGFLADICKARAQSEASLRAGLGPYGALADLLSERIGQARSPLGARRHHLQQHLRQPLRPPRRAASRRARARRRHRAGHSHGDRRRARRRAGQDHHLARRRRRAIDHRRIGDRRGGGSRHRLHPDERPRLWRHPQYPGRAIWRPPCLCEHPDAGFRAGVPVGRPAA